MKIHQCIFGALGVTKKMPLKLKKLKIVISPNFACAVVKDLRQLGYFIRVSRWKKVTKHINDLILVEGAERILSINPSKIKTMPIYVNDTIMAKVSFHKFYVNHARYLPMRKKRGDTLSLFLAVIIKICDVSNSKQSIALHTPSTVRFIPAAFSLSPDLAENGPSIF